MEKINVGLVGCGYVANSHLHAWKRLRDVKVMAVTDINGSLARNTAQVWRIPHFYNSPGDMMDGVQIDLVDICTPPHVHASLAVDAMKRGHGVLIEKPMTMTTKDAEDIVNCQRATGMRAGVIHNWLFEPVIVAAMSLVRKGRFGDLLGLNIEALCTRDDSMAANRNHWCHSLQGGRFSEILAHPIYLIRSFLGEAVIDNVKVSKIGDYPWMKSDELCATLRSGDRFGRIYTSFNAPRDAIFLDLFGKEAILKLDIINSTAVMFPRRKKSRFSKGFDSLAQAGQLIRSTLTNVSSLMSGRWLSGHERCIRLFAESFSGQGEVPVTVKEGYNVIKTLEEMCVRIEEEEKATRPEL